MADLTPYKSHKSGWHRSLFFVQKAFDFHFLLLFFYFFCKPRSRDTPLFRRGSIEPELASLRVA